MLSMLIREPLSLTLQTRTSSPGCSCSATGKPTGLPRDKRRCRQMFTLRPIRPEQLVLRVLNGQDRVRLRLSNLLSPCSTVAPLLVLMHGAGGFLRLTRLLSRRTLTRRSGSPFVAKLLLSPFPDNLALGRSNK